jgi:hypothetical protein
VQVDAAVVSSEAFVCRTDVAVVDTAAFLRVGVELDGLIGTDPWAPLASRSTVPYSRPRGRYETVQYETSRAARGVGAVRDFSRLKHAQRTAGHPDHRRRPPMD